MKRLKINTKEQKLWLTSDSHYQHANINAGTTNWVDLPKPFNVWKGENQKELTEFCLENGIRPFATIEEMNRALIKGINDNVGVDDILIHGGDWSFGNKDNVASFRNSLNCQNIHLIHGNHDEHIQDPKNDFKRLFSSVQDYKEISVDGKLIVLMHYSMRIWNKSHHGSFHLYGHSHSSLEHAPWGKSMDIGVDNAFKLLGEYRPFSYDEVFRILDKRGTSVLDHHGDTER